MRVVFIGTGDIGLPVLRWLLNSAEHQVVGIVTQPDKPVGRDQRVQAPPIKAAVAELGPRVLQPQRIKREEAICELAAFTPDVVVVMAYGQILPRAVLKIPKVACLNLHASLLPRHRGAAPIQAAILAGDRETGITVMYMDEGLDTGDLLLQKQLAIAADETGGSLHDRLAEIAPAALDEALTLLGTGSAPRTPQNNAEATYAPKLEREHGLTDWHQSVQSIERKIRAFDPWPGSYTVLRDASGQPRKLKIFGVSIQSSIGSPGTLVSTADGLAIGAADGSLLLRDVQLEGKKRMSAADLLRGNSWIANASVVAAP